MDEKSSLPEEKSIAGQGLGHSSLSMETGSYLKSSLLPVLSQLRLAGRKRAQG